MRRHHNNCHLEFPEQIFNLDIQNMTTTSVKDTVSGRNLTRSGTSYFTFVNDQELGRGIKFTTRISSNVFSDTYNSNTYPKLWGAISDISKPISLIMLLDTSGVSTSNRYGIVALYNIMQLSMWSTGSNPAFPIFNNITSSYIAVTKYPIYGNAGFWYKGIDSTKTYYSNANGIILTTGSRRSGSNSSSATIQFGKSQESSYYADAGVIVYGVTMYEGILEPEHVDALANAKTTDSTRI